MDGLPVLVTNIAAGQPASQHAPVGVSRQRPGAARVGLGTGEQVGVTAGPAAGDPALLGADVSFEFLVDGNGGLTPHLGVVVPQVGGALAVVDEAVELQRAGVAGAQPAPDQDQGDEPGGRIGPAAEAGGALHLGHDVLGQVAGEPWRTRRAVAGEERGGCRQRVVPAVLADRQEETLQGADPASFGGGTARPGCQPSQVAFQERPVDASQGAHGGCGSGQELAELRQRLNAGHRGRGAEPRAQPEPHPPLAEFPQPRLGNPVKAQAAAGGRTAAVEREAGQPGQPPDVPRVLGFPADAIAQRLHGVPRVDQERLAARPHPAVGPGDPAC